MAGYSITPVEVPVKNGSKFFGTGAGNIDRGRAKELFFEKRKGEETFFEKN